MVYLADSQTQKLDLRNVEGIFLDKWFNQGEGGMLLDEAGLAKNTIVVYTSDQGFYLGEHGWFDKRFMYEESFRMPLMIRYPKEIEPAPKSMPWYKTWILRPPFWIMQAWRFPGICKENLSGN